MIHPMQNAAIVWLVLVDMVLVSLSQIALWQRKEYRLDRMKSYLNSPEGSLTQHRAVLIAALLVAIGWVFALQDNNVLAEYAGIASLLTVLVGHAIRIRKKGVMRPTLTSRSGSLLAGVALLCMAWGTYVLIPDVVQALQYATFVFFLPATIACVVALSVIPTAIQKRRVIARAKQLRQSLSALTAIGITGSVGKTSTKTYLLHILGGESKTVRATSEHRNAPYVVAQDMLARLTPKTTTYIAEMGAYKKGEIAELAALVQPKIGIVTAITNQHAALFGSLKNLADAKWELVDALSKDGVAVLNADDERIVKKAKRFSGNMIWFSLQKKADVFLKGSSLTVAGETYTVSLPVIGQGQIASAVAAAAAASALGVAPKTIVRMLESLPVIPRTMELKKGKQGARIVDDTYSASEASVMNAIQYLQEISSTDTRLVLVPIIELGSEGASVHTRIGKALSSLSASVYIYGDAYKQDIQAGLGKKPFAQVEWFSDPSRLAQAIADNVTSDTTLVLEGRLPSSARSAVI